MRKKRFLALLLTAVLGLSLLSGCGQTANNPKETKEKETVKPEANKPETGAEKKETERIELTMWGGWSGDQVAQLEAQLNSYNESQDRYMVKYVVQEAMEEKLLTAIAGGELPDILLWDRYNTGVYARRGALEPIDDLVKQDGVELADFFEPAVDEMTVENTLYGLPLLVDARILFYNKALFREAGVEADSIKNWDDLEAAAVKLTKREGTQLDQAGFSLKDVGLFSIWLAQAGGKLVDTSANPAKTAYNSEQGMTVLRYWDKLLNQDKVYELGFEDSYGGNGFKAGKVAITYDGPWSLTDYEKAGIDYGVIANPVGPNGDKGAFMGGFGLALPKGGKNKEAAWDFVKWWTTQPKNGVDFAKISGWIPANKKAAADSYFTENEYYKVFVEVMGYAQIRPKTAGYSDAEGLALIPQLQKFQAGEITAEDALSEAQKQGDKILAESEK